MPRIFLLLLVFGVSCAAFAQTDQASWANLSALQPGQKIQVVGMTSKKQSGNFVSLSDTALSYRETNGEQSIAKQDVLSVKLLENKHRLRNTLIVAGVGAGVGAGIGAASHKSCPSQSFCLDFGGAFHRESARCSVAWGCRSGGSFALSPHDLPICQVSSHSSALDLRTSPRQAQASAWAFKDSIRCWSGLGSGPSGSGGFPGLPARLRPLQPGVAHTGPPARAPRPPAGRAGRYPESPTAAALGPRQTPA